MKVIMPDIKEPPIGAEEIVVKDLVSVLGVFEEDQDFVNHPSSLSFEVDGDRIILPKTDKQLIVLCDRHGETGELIQDVKHKLIFPDDCEDDE